MKPYLVSLLAACVALQGCASDATLEARGPTRVAHSSLSVAQARDCITKGMRQQLGLGIQPIIEPWGDGYRFINPSLGLGYTRSPGFLDVTPNPTGGSDIKDYSLMFPIWIKLMHERIEGCGDV